MGEWALFNGWCQSNGVKPTKMPPDDLCDLIYYWLLKDAEAKERYKLDIQLSIPPANMAPDANDPMWSEDAEMAQFMKASKK